MASTPNSDGFHLVAMASNPREQNIKKRVLNSFLGILGSLKL